MPVDPRFKDTNVDDKTLMDNLNRIFISIKKKATELTNNVPDTKFTSLLSGLYDGDLDLGGGGGQEPIINVSNISPELSVISELSNDCIDQPNKVSKLNPQFIEIIYKKKYYCIYGISFEYSKKVVDIDCKKNRIDFMFKIISLIEQKDFSYPTFKNILKTIDTNKVPNNMNNSEKRLYEFMRIISFNEVSLIFSKCDNETKPQLLTIIPYSENNNFLLNDYGVIPPQNLVICCFAGKICKEEDPVYDLGTTDYEDLGLGGGIGLKRTYKKTHKKYKRKHTKPQKHIKKNKSIIIRSKTHKRKHTKTNNHRKSTRKHTKQYK